MPTWLMKLFHSLGRKQAAKRTGIAQIPTPISAEAKGAEYFNTLVNAGLKPEDMSKYIKSEKDIIRLLNRIKHSEEQSITRQFGKTTDERFNALEKYLEKRDTLFGPEKATVTDLAKFKDKKGIKSIPVKEQFTKKPNVEEVYFDNPNDPRLFKPSITERAENLKGMGKNLEKLEAERRAIYGNRPTKQENLDFAKKRIFEIDDELEKLSYGEGKYAKMNRREREAEMLRLQDESSDFQKIPGIAEGKFNDEFRSFKLNIAKNNPEFNQDLAKQVINKEIFKDVTTEQRKQVLDALESVLRNPEGMASGGLARVGFAGGLLARLYKGVKGLQHGAIERKLRQKYGKGFEAHDKAMNEATEIVNQKKLKIVADKMKEVNIGSDDYVELVDESIRLTDREMYKDIKRWENTRPDLADKTRALHFPDWAEARYGEDYQGVLNKRQASALKQKSDEIDKMYPDTDGGIQGLVDEIDDMNKANIDEIIGGRKKNATGGLARVGMFVGGSVWKKFIEQLFIKSSNNIRQGKGLFKGLTQEQMITQHDNLTKMLKKWEMSGSKGLPEGASEFLGMNDLQISKAIKDAEKQVLSKPTKTLEGLKKEGTIDISNPEVADEFSRFMRESDPKGYKDLEQKIELESFDVTGKKGHASGGIAGQLHLNRPGYFKGKIIKGITSLGKKKKPTGKVWKSSEGETQGIAMGFNEAELKGLDQAMAKGTALSDAMKKMGLNPGSTKDYDKFNKLVSEGMIGFPNELKEQIIRAKYGDVVDQKLLNQMLADNNPQRISEVMGTIDEGLIMQQKGMHPDEIVETIKTSLKRKPNAEGGIAGQLHLNRPGYGGGLLVKLNKILKGVGKKKNVWRGFETDYKNILRGDWYPEEFSGRFFYS